MKRLVSVALLLALVVGCSDATTRVTQFATESERRAMIPATCPVTRPPDPPLTPPEKMIEFLRAGSSNPEQFRPLGPGQFFYGNDALWLSLPENGVVWNQKQRWWRATPGKLRIEGRRLDSASSEMVSVARVPDGYGELGFQATGWAFPSTGCWEVQASVGSDSPRLVLWVIPARTLRLARLPGRLVRRRDSSRIAKAGGAVAVIAERPVGGVAAPAQRHARVSADEVAVSILYLDIATQKQWSVGADGDGGWR